MNSTGADIIWGLDSQRTQRSLSLSPSSFQMPSYLLMELNVLQFETGGMGYSRWAVWGTPPQRWAVWGTWHRHRWSFVCRFIFTSLALKLHPYRKERLISQRNKLLSPNFWKTESYDKNKASLPVIVLKGSVWGTLTLDLESWMLKPSP